MSPLAAGAAAVLAAAPVACSPTPPDAVRGPTRSVWVEFSDPPAGHGLSALVSSEGTYRYALFDGVTARTVDSSTGWAWAPVGLALVLIGLGEDRFAWVVTVAALLLGGADRLVKLASAGETR